jgi:hypothetical protein
VSIETDGGDRIEQLLASGKLTDSSSIAEIEAALSGEEPKAAAETGADKEAEAAKAAEADKATTETGTAETAAGETQAADKAAATDGKQTAETTSSARDQQTAQTEGSETDDDKGSFKSHPMYGVLKGTRNNLAEARQKLQEAEQRAQEERQRREAAERERDELRQAQASQATQTQEVQAAAAAAGVKGDVKTVDVSKLRGNFPEEIVDAIEALQQTNAALNQQVTELRQRDAGRARTEQMTAAEALQADIDSVPALAEWQAEGKTKWKAACALDDALREDPDWKDKSRAERFQEIARQLGGQPQQQATTTTVTTDTAAGTKARADAKLAEAADKAIPLSHSGLPAGSPPAQTEAESFGRMDVKQIESQFSKMSTDQIEALLAKVS